MQEVILVTEIVSFLIVIAVSFIGFKFLQASNAYEKIISFYFILTNIIILILANSVANFDEILDIAIILFLLKLVTVLFLLYNKKKI